MINRTIVLDAIKQKLEDNIAELEIALGDYAAASNMDEGDTVDPDDFSKQTEYKEMQMRMQVQLDTARSQVVRLNDLSSKSHAVAEAGALVETNKNILFLGLSFSGFSLDGKEFIGVSVESPAYNTIRGKTVGDQFQLGKEEYTIKNIS